MDFAPAATADRPIRRASRRVAVTVIRVQVADRRCQHCRALLSAELFANPWLTARLGVRAAACFGCVQTQAAEIPEPTRLEQASLREERAFAGAALGLGAGLFVDPVVAVLAMGLGAVAGWAADRIHRRAARPLPVR